jgi:ATP-dependent DNA helicase DinG
MKKTPRVADFFPFPEIRPAQDEALSVLEKAYASNKKFVVLEIPTGGGKSGIAIAAAQWAKAVLGGGTYILSPQKSLTSQYFEDFAKVGLRELRGRNSYLCSDFGTDCERGSILRGNDKEICKNCPYRVAKQEFIASSVGVTNFSYYLKEMQYAGELGRRSMLILDEGHNTERLLLEEMDIEITSSRQSQYGVRPAPGTTEIDEYKEWVETVLCPAIERYVRVEENVRYPSLDDRIKSAQRISSARGALVRLARFFNSDEMNEWVAWTNPDNDVVIRPLTPKLHARRMLFDNAEIIIVMSATILDFKTFTRNLGIGADDCEFLALPSDFPKENREICYRPVGSMARRHQDGTLPLLVQAIKSVLSESHPAEKGIVHTHTHKINEYLVRNLADFSNRIVTYRDSRDRERAIEAHRSSSRPTVLFSPGMAEGLDLKDHLSRFQIVCKVPYPYLDEYTKSRMKLDPDWYQWRTAVTLVQATGRSVRSKEDYAVTYILDSDFVRFVAQNKNSLPRWWIYAIRWPKKKMSFAREGPEPDESPTKGLF